jgi:hypothetical protein
MSHLYKNLITIIHRLKILLYNIQTELNLHTSYFQYNNNTNYVYYFITYSH